VQKSPLDPDVADTAPSDSALTIYDEEHLITYCVCEASRHHEAALGGCAVVKAHTKEAANGGGPSTR
jgi:hypothetical protein